MRHEGGLINVSDTLFSMTLKILADAFDPKV
jgi:hypothetical protein